MAGKCTQCKDGLERFVRTGFYIAEAHACAALPHRLLRLHLGLTRGMACRRADVPLGAYVL